MRRLALRLGLGGLGGSLLAWLLHWGALHEDDAPLHEDGVYLTEED